MKEEIKIFFTAVMFYTRIPCPAWVGHDAEYLNKATRYLPLMGWIVGSVTGGVIVLSSYVFPAQVSVIIGLVAGILLTGAFHEDGFADVCDGFGGGWTKEKILLIMKDSRVGTYGVAGLILLLMMKLFVLSELMARLSTTNVLLLILVAHTTSRLMPIVIMRTLTYAREDGDSKAKPVAQKTAVKSIVIATLITIIPLGVAVVTFSPLILLLFVPCLIMTLWLMRYFKKWIGGYTGDCLGATQQLNETLIYLTVLAICRFL